MFSELECYQCLVQIEAALKSVVEATVQVPKKGRRKTNALVKDAIPRLQSAGDVLAIAYENGWLQ